MAKCRLSGNMLKWIAAISMVIDHVGVILFPDTRVLRVLGRLAFPIFAFMIAEGCRYTKNKWRYFGTILGVGAICQLVLFLYNGSMEMNILLTFSISVLLVFVFAWIKEQIFAENAPIFYPLAGVFLLGGMIVCVGALGALLDLDYGAVGCMVPLLAAVLHPPKGRESSFLHRIDRPITHVLCLGLGLLLLAMDAGGTQWFSLCALPLLMLYSGKRGKRRMKYFFYVFYPAHLLVIQGIAYLIR